MKNPFAIALALLGSGCVTIPVPPAGDNIGEFGRIEILVRYVPNLSSAWSYLTGEQPKPTSSK